MILSVIIPPVLLLALTLPLPAQPTYTRVAGPHVAAHVETSPATGRFWITAGRAENDSVQLLFRRESNITSYVVFRVDRPGRSTFVCTMPEESEPRPSAPDGGPIPFRPFDAMRVRHDSLSLTWHDVDGYDITMRFIPDYDAGPWTTGGDVLIEFEYSLRDGATAGTLGILLMSDLYNSDARIGTGPGLDPDRAAVLTDMSYHNYAGASLFHAAPVPEWYLLGRFTVDTPRTHSFGIHRLRGRSRGGVELDAPELLAIDSWEYLGSHGWDLEQRQAPVRDCASGVRWQTRATRGTIRTAYGLSDAGGNDMAYGYAPEFFVALRSLPEIRLDSNGVADSTMLRISAWVLGTTAATSTYLRLDAKHDSEPGLASWLTANGTSSYRTDLSLEVPQRLDFVYRIGYPFDDTVVTFRLLYAIDNGSDWSAMVDGGTIVIPVLGPRPVDRSSPLVLRVDSSRSPERSWTLRVRDRSDIAGHSGVADVAVHEPGSDTLRTAIAFIEPADWQRCDSSAITVRVVIIDRTQPTDIVVEAIDCNGNRATDTLRHLGEMSDVALDDARQRHARIDPTPSRAGDAVRLVLDGVGETDGELVVRALDGRVVARRVASMDHRGDGAVALGNDVAGLAPGVYFVELRTRHATARARLVLLRD